MSNLVTEKTTKEEMDRVYSDYPDTAPEGFQPFHESRVNPIFWDIPDFASVLDIGCNSGEFMKRIKEKRPSIKIKGIDMSETAVKIARGKGLDVVQGDGEKLPFPDASFDYVVLMEVIVHVHNPRNLLSEIKRVLKKDGVLIGSSPLKELEMSIWDDKRLHHAYYASDELYDLLKEFFFDVHFKILKGAHFSVSMAGSYIGDKDVEVLFKCGSVNMPPWDYKLLEKDRLKVWMGPTQGSGDVYYRMTGFAEKMNLMERCDVLYDNFDYLDKEAPGRWQEAFKRTAENKPCNMVVVNQLEGMLKIADMSIWQITSSYSVLAFFYALKHVHPDKPFITEVDDWIFDVPSYNIASHSYRPNSEPQRIAYEQLKLSDVFIVSTQFIKEKLEEFQLNKPIYIVPNSIDFDVWDNLKIPEKDDKIRIGYTGCGNHDDDILIIKEPVLALLEEFKNLMFYMPIPFTSWDDVDHPRVFRGNTWVSVKYFPQMVADWNLDIGVAPLKDSNFNRAKSNLRWLEYSALKIPTIASNVYPFQKSIRDGIDGIICNSKKSWYDSLRSLITDPSKRSRIGLEAYERVRKHFDMGQVAKTYKSILEVLKHESQ